MSVVLRAVVALASVALPAAAGAEPWTLTSGEVRVRCRLTVGGSFDAITSQVSGRFGLEAAGAGVDAGRVTVALDSLDTGIELRNAHLRERYLEVGRAEEFRHAVLTGLELVEPLPAGHDAQETEFSGLLSLHGVERRIEGRAELERRDDRLSVEAEFALSLAAFEIPPPRYLGVGVRDEIRITVTLEARSGTVSGEGSR